LIFANLIFAAHIVYDPSIAVSLDMPANIPLSIVLSHHDLFEKAARDRCLTTVNMDSISIA
jgi:hypothetical protein